MWCMEKPTAHPNGQAKAFLLSTQGSISAFASEPDARAAMTEGDLVFANRAELQQATAFRVYEDPADLLVHIDELGGRR